jgi:hypothetical protein
MLKKIKPLVFAIFGLSAIISSATPAAAIQYLTNTVYRATGTLGQEVYISGTANSAVQVKLGSQARASARIAGACGEVRISPPSSGDFTGLQVDGVAINVASLPSSTLPSCVSGAFAEPRTANFKTPTGQVIIVGKTPNEAVTISLPSEVTRTVRINACGFGVLRPSATSPLPTTFIIGTTNYTTATLPNATTGPLCRTVNGASFGYKPASW